MTIGDGWKFKLGDRVTKINGSSWTGHVVGFYSTKLTPRGYDVESENEPGSVQLYPEAALIATLVVKEDECKALRKERDEARALVTEANNSLYGSQGYFHSLNGGEFDKYHLANGIEKLKEGSRKEWRRAETLQKDVDNLHNQLASVNEDLNYWIDTCGGG